MSDERNAPVLLPEALRDHDRVDPWSERLRPVVERLASRFRDGGCCGKRPTLTLADLEPLGLTPIPTVFVATLGQIVPRSGWRAMCVYVYETLLRKPFPVPEKGEEWGDIVVEALTEKLNEQRAQAG